MIRPFKALLIAAGSLATTGLALAEEPPPPPEPEPPKVTTSALAVPKGKILIAGSTLNISLIADSAGKPTSFAPSVWYGVDDKITVGLTHDFGTTPWTPRPTVRFVPIVTPLGPGIAAAGLGICVTGDNDGLCPSPYDNLGLDLLYVFKAEKLSLSAHPGIDVSSFDPFTLSIRLGVLGRYTVNDKISVVFDPRLQFGLTERDPANGEAIDLPVWAWYAVDDKISAYLHTGLNGRFEDFGDNASVPLQIGGNYKVNDKLTAGLDFAFLRINDSADGRMLGLRVVYAL